MVAPTLLVMDGISVRRGKSEVLQSVNLMVGEGEVVILKGENGAGKSTLLEAAAGILNLSAGSVHHRGNLIRDDEGRRNQPPPFGLTLQSGGFCQDELVRERVVTAAAVAGSDVDSEWVNEQLLLWDLRHRSDDRIVWLSGGMKRRVGVLAGMVPALLSAEARLVLLDEPSEGLDERSIHTLKTTISQLHGMGHSFLIATHDESLLTLATRVVSVGEKKVSEEPQNEAGVSENQFGEKSEKTPIMGGHNPLSAASLWANGLEMRTNVSTTNRTVAGIISLAVVTGLMIQTPLPTERVWLALLSLTPALISSFVKPGFIGHLSDSRAGDWWNAHLGRRLEMRRPHPTLMVIPFLITLISCYFLLGGFTQQILIASICMAALTLGSAMVYALESQLPRQTASLSMLLLVILIWPFLLTVDLIAMPSADFSLTEATSQVATILVVPTALRLLIPMLSLE